jgi:hypothetical protein
LLADITVWWLVGAAWAVAGTSGFVFWWTRDYRLDRECAILALLWAFLGPLAWPAGWWLHGRSGAR